VLSGTEMVKLALSINNIRFDNIGDVKEHLLGIDTLFLEELTNSLGEFVELEYNFYKLIELIETYVNEKFNKEFSQDE
jgi:hypothetical protein